MSGKQKDVVGELLHFFVKSVPNCSGTQLVKFLYLADMHALQFLGKAITDLEYIWYGNGPFDSRILNRLSALCEVGAIREIAAAGDIRYVSTTTPSLNRLSERQIAIVEHVVEVFGEKPVRSLARFVQGTPPMAKARRTNGKGKPLDMAIVEDRRELFEDIRLGISQLDDGRGIPFSFKRRKTPQSA